MPTHLQHPGRPRRAMRVLLIGAAAIGCGALLLILPIFLPPNSLNRFIVVAGFLIGCWGISCIIHGTWDCLRRKEG